MPCLEITTMVGCPLMCTFCPQDKLKASYGKGEKYLSLENFRTVLDKVPKHVRIDFSGMSEPWANPDATAMLTETLARGYNATVYTTLVGMSRDEAAVVGALLFMHREQVETLVIHLPDANGNMRGFKPSQEYNAVLEIFAEIGPSLRAFEMMTMDDKARLHPEVAHALGRGTLAKGLWFPVNRARSLDENEIGAQRIERALRHEKPVSCSYTPFYDQNVLLPNGDVVLCCMDYSIKHKIGNLLEQEYYDIFASPGMGLVHAENTRAEFSEKSICKSCSRAKSYRTTWTQQFWEAVE